MLAHFRHTGSDRAELRKVVDLYAFDVVDGIPKFLRRAEVPQLNRDQVRPQYHGGEMRPDERLTD